MPLGFESCTVRGGEGKTLKHSNHVSSIVGLEVAIKGSEMTLSSFYFLSLNVQCVSFSVTQWHEINKRNTHMYVFVGES